MFKKLSIGLLLSLGLSGLFTSSARAAIDAGGGGGSAETKAGTWSGVCTGSSAYGAQTVPTIQGLECLVANVLASAITLLGIVSFVMFLLGGFQYLISGGNTKGMEAGRNSITFAVLGIVLALTSIIIVNIISRLTGIQTILTFQVLQLQ